MSNAFEYSNILSNNILSSNVLSSNVFSSNIFSASHYTCDYLQVAINQSNMNDNALEELSWAREPRQKGTGREPEVRENNLPKFSEWAAGRQSSLDTETLSKHVKQMVEVSWILPYMAFPCTHT